MENILTNIFVTISYLESNSTVLFYFLFIFGACFGSFSSVVVYRLPIILKYKPKNFNLSIPRSHCPKCNNKLKGYQNIPILSFLFLRGKCGFCKCRIPFRYPLLEFFSGLLFAITSTLLSTTLTMLITCFLLWIILTFFYYKLELIFSNNLQ